MVMVLICMDVRSKWPRSAKRASAPAAAERGHFTAKWNTWG